MLNTLLITFRLSINIAQFSTKLYYFDIKQLKKEYMIVNMGFFSQRIHGLEDLFRFISS